ncbi:MAG: prepilin-type N-terminal cleavage/methylation domain-containing protein [Gammaproteobacteria bacterium]
MKQNKQSQQQGFTLIELAIVLFVVGLLLGGFLAPLANKIEFENRVETQLALEEIKDILLGFAMESGYLPCPDTDNDGVEDLVTAVSGAPGLTCASETGRLPSITLGVNGEDAWDNPYIYRVDDEFADRSDPPNTDGKSSDSCAPTANISFSLCSLGNITVLDGNAGNTIANNIPVLIVSEGKNFTETPSTDEAENVDGDAVFVQRNYSANDTNAFDDIIVWISPHILRNRMVEAGILP